MSAEAAMAAFPRRPLKLVDTRGRKVGRIFLALLSLAAALSAAYLTWGPVQEASLYADLRARGVAADVLHVDGPCYSVRRRLTGTREAVGCDLIVTYRTAPDHGDRIIRTTMRHNGAPGEFRPQVRYDPQAPERALLIGELQAGQRWSGYIVAGLIWVLALLPILLWRVVAQRGLARAARQPEPVGVPIVRWVRVMPYNMLEVEFLQGDGKIVCDRLGHPDLPLMLPPPEGAEPDTLWAMALLAPNGRPYLLDERLAWLDLSDAERQAVYRGIAA